MGVERRAGPGREHVANAGDDPDDEEGLELEASLPEMRHHGAEELEHDDDEQQPLDEAEDGVGEGLVAA